MVGDGFVAGRTGCQFGSSGAMVAAEVLSSGEATCVSSAGVRGASSFGVSTVYTADGFIVDESGVSFEYVGAVSVERVSPVVANVHGGSVLAVVAAGVPDGSSVVCAVGGT